MTEYHKLNRLRVASSYKSFIENEVLPPLGLEAASWWRHFETILLRHAPRNRELLSERDRLQKHLDDWHREYDWTDQNFDRYMEFLREIGYLHPELQDCDLRVEDVDEEIADIAAPQLVVPINNARFAVNAANARWGSLYDALYGSDVIPDSGETARGLYYNPRRGQAVFDFCNDWMDQALPLEEGSHRQIRDYRIDDGLLVAERADGHLTRFRDAEFRGHREAGEQILLLRHHGLHVELHVNRDHPVGSTHPAGLADIQLEAAVTVIQDGEDSVTAVDVEDKLRVYGNWLKLVRRKLEVPMEKAGKAFIRRMNSPRTYRSPRGDELRLPGCARMLLRNVGLHMTTDLVLDEQDEEMPEGLVDALTTVPIALLDPDNDGREGSIYIVKPKLHGPEEVAFSCEVFRDIEDALGIARNRVKIGVMDEERRTSVNLKACIQAARERIIFINTGFLDRTGDEIHSGMQAGPFLPKGELKHAPWMQAYEDRNVDIGLACGLDRVGQIGKGMWAAPDAMHEMVEQKIAHPLAGASCAWVPSPTAAVLHALHYHQVDVRAVQQKLRGKPRARLETLLQIPLLPPSRELPEKDIQQELDNNAQGILGYVVKWIDQGIGCSKVPDIHDVGLMEDRATLRISSQHIANWLEHGLCDREQVEQTFRRMARVVDRQNRDQPGYRPMAPGFDGPAFRCALDLVLEGVDSPNGYTETLLRRYRRQVKAGD